MGLLTSKKVTTAAVKEWQSGKRAVPERKARTTSW